MMTPQAIKLLREGLGLNQTQLAAQIGVSENTVRRWELGYVHPRWEKAVELSRLADELARRPKRALVS